MDLSIAAKPRSVFGKQTNKLRKTGTLPGILYGPAFAKASAGQRGALPLEVSAKEFEKVYRAAGENTLIDLKIEGKGDRKVLIHEVAHHFMSRTPIHVDFYEVDLTRKIHAKIPLHFVGVAPAVKELGGILIKTLNEVEVEALPTDLPQFIEVDISGLATFENFVHVSDLKVSDKVKILANPEEVITTVQPPRTEEELAELEKPTAEAEAEAVKAVAAEPEPAPGEVAESEKSASSADKEAGPAPDKGKPDDKK